MQLSTTTSDSKSEKEVRKDFGRKNLLTSPSNASVKASRFAVEYWRKRVFRPTYGRDAEVLEWYAQIQYRGRREKVGLGTNSDGANPEGGLILSGSTLYGTAHGGGPTDDGTVFALSLAPLLGIALTNNQVVLSWPAWAPAFTLQTTTNLVPPRVWTTNSTPPAIVNGQFTMTNYISSTQQFYRLSQ